MLLLRGAKVFAGTVMRLGGSRSPLKSGLLGNGLALFFRSLDGWLVGRFIHAAMEFGFEFIFRTTEFAHAAAEAAGESGKLLGPEQYEDQDGDDDHFRSSKRSDSRDDWSIHGFIGNRVNERAQCGLSPHFCRKTASVFASSSMSSATGGRRPSQMAPNSMDGKPFSGSWRTWSLEICFGVERLSPTPKPSAT